MEQQIQYATTTDGVRIAYSVAGSGPVLVYQSGYPFNHLRGQMELEVMRTLYERLAEGCTLIRFDHRGCGMSQRDRPARSEEDLVLDLDAVIASVGVEALSLSGWGPGGIPVALWTARNPGRAQHLVLIDVGALNPTRSLDATRMNALVGLARSDWELFTESAASVYFGWASGDGARSMARYLRDACDPSTFIDSLQWQATDALTEKLMEAGKHASVPTLIVRHEETIWPSMDAVIELAASIPKARLVSLEGPWITTTERAIRLADAILGFTSPESTREQKEPASSAAQGGTAIILFADIVDSTALTERLGDAAFRAKARDLDAALRNVIRENGGTPIEGKLLGDGVLAVFTSARQAIEAALACGKAGEDGGLPLHLGLHAGDVIREGNNVYGGAVNIASRISGLSAPGEVLVSHTVRDLARTSAGVAFEDRGEQSLKGVGEPVRVWAVVSARLPDGQESRSE
jgi:class 3 adenylate cyclase